MRIWGSPALGNPVRVAIFLKEKGIEVEWVPVDLFGGQHRSPEFLRMNPAGLVPVLELDDGTCISETVAISRYFEHIQPEPPLMGEGAAGEALVEMWQRRVELLFYDAVRMVFRHSSEMVKALEPVQVAEWAQLNRPKVIAALEMFEPQLREHPFIAGDQFTVADITAVLAFIMMKMIQIDVPETCPAVARWRDAILSRPSVVAALKAG